MIQYKERKYLNDQLKRGGDEKNNKVRSQLTNGRTGEERKGGSIQKRTTQNKRADKPNGQPTHTHIHTNKKEKKKRLAAAAALTHTDRRRLR